MEEEKKKKAWSYPSVTHKERPLSSSSLGEFAKSPEHYLKYLVQPRTQTPAMLLGSVCHLLVLEPDKFDDNYFVIDIEQRPEQAKGMTSNINKKWKQKLIEENEGKDLLTEDVLAQAKLIVERLKQREKAWQMIKYCQEREVKRDWKYAGINCTGRIDLESDIYIADLKFVANADPEEWIRKMFYYNYPMQGGMYVDAAAGGKYDYKNPKDFYFILIETEEPFGVSIVKLNKEIIDYGVRTYRELVRKYKWCLAKNIWPSYEWKAPFGTDGIHQATLPYYLRD